jgi:hypothetical protein
MTMTNQTIEIKSIHAQLLSEMERSLGLLAARWRSRQDKPEAGDIVRQYQAILRCMIELGYRDGLDAESELPDEFLPQEYFDLFKSS